MTNLFSETVRTLPAGAFSEKISDMPYKLPKLNSSLVEEKLLKKDDYQQIKEELRKAQAYKINYSTRKKIQ